MIEKVYLSGKMGGRPVHEVLAERAIAKDHCTKLGLAYYDPAESEGLDGQPYDAKIDMGVREGIMQGFVSKDEANLDTCTVCLVLTGDTPSDGTWWEMARAYYHLKIPIVMVAPNRVTGEHMGFSNIKVPHMFGTVEAALAFIRNDLRTTEEK